MFYPSREPPSNLEWEYTPMPTNTYLCVGEMCYRSSRRGVAAFYVEKHAKKLVNIYIFVQIFTINNLTI